MATCLNCGKEVSNSAVHCPYCGKNLENQSLQLGLMALLCGISPGLIITSLINLILKLPIIMNWGLAVCISCYLFKKCNNWLFFLGMGLCCLILFVIISSEIEDILDVSPWYFFLPELPKHY